MARPPDWLSPLPPPNAPGVPAMHICSFCGIKVNPDADDHHVCVPDGKGGAIATTEREAVLAQIENREPLGAAAVAMPLTIQELTK